MPGTLHTLLAVTKGPNGVYLQLHGQVPPTLSPLHVSLHPSPQVSEVPSLALSPPKDLAAHPASTLAGGSSLAFLPLHALPCTAARRLFLKGKADLVPALGQPSSSMSSTKRSRLDRVLETSAPSVNSRSLIRGGIACRLLHLGFSHLPYRNLKN